ncbi:Tfp pilus assembly protein FimT/FimU [Haloferula sp. A504]|uniref:Tfp pilus assembly protein FimT/FimU n=1 Tax=Haloferula sp. A504 TaxID=3373601 RepID=UPI0031C85483|nr:type II secretion system GspH family protein [Verrucomicrobiaceae bacterium E54]
MKLRRHSLSGFTLVELLVVILIISVLLTIGTVALNGAGGKGVTTATATTEALFDEARSIAIGKGASSRLLIDADDPSSPNYLRRLVIVGEILDDEGNSTEPKQWEVVGRGYTLPDRVFFSKEFSRKDHESGSGEIETFDLTGQRISAAYQGTYYFYEFNSEGICTTGLTDDGYVGPSFVVGAGVRQPGDEDPRTTGDAKRDFGGFVIWRNGSTSVFRDPKQILGGETNPKFF